MKAEPGKSRSIESFLVAVAMALALAGCGGGGAGGGTGGSAPAATSGAGIGTIGGTVSGLVGTVVLQNNGGDNLSLAAEGNFTFATPVASGNTYNVTVITQPAGQICNVSNGSGTVSGNVGNVTVVCSSGTSGTSYSVGGTISGLVGSVALQDNAGDTLIVSANGTFTFATQVASGSPYNVTVLTQPAGQTCTVSTGWGTISGNNVTNVAVTCSTNTYRVWGVASGLAGSVVLQINSGDNLTLRSNGSFSFPTQLADGSSYSVTVLTQPAGQSCSVANGTGTIAGSNITNVAVTCAASTYTIGGTINGLNGSMVLQNNGGDNLTVSTNGSFTFATAMAYGKAYNVTLSSLQNANQTCTIAGGSGTVTANITSVAVNCVALILGVSPATVNAGDPAFVITATGTGYTPASVLKWNGSARITTYVSPTKLTAQITAADIASTGTASVTVANSGPPAVASPAVQVTIAPPAVPQIIGVSPATVTAGGPAFVITALGTGYTPTSVVQWNGSARTTTYVSSTELIAQLTAADIASVGTASVTVANSNGVSPAAQVTMAPPSKDAVAFQLDATHSGVISFNAVSLPAASTWSVNLGGAPSYALIAAGKVFVTVNVSGNTQLFALNQTTGATVWGPVVIAGAANAAYDSATVFVHSGAIGQPGLMQAYDAATGQLKWSTSLTGQYSFSSPPTAANGFVYTGGAGVGGTLYAVRQSDGVIAWTQPVANGDSSAPAVSADSVYVTYPCQTYSLRPSTGEPIWHDNTGCSGGGGAAPVVANGALYAPNGTGGSYNGSTFNAATGALLGSYVADNPPAIGAQNGYFLQSKILRGISLASNTVLWSFTGDGLLVTSPIVVNSGASSYVFVGSSSGNLYAVDATTGAQLWAVNVGAPIPNGSGWGARMQISALSAGNGLLVVPAGNTLTAYTLSTAP